MEIFEQATRTKLRFESPAGLLSVEDLWDLPLTSSVNKPNLDAIAVGLHRRLRQESEEASFVTPKESNSKELQLSFDIVKRVIEVRMAERDRKAEAAKRAETKQRLLEIMSRKENEALESKSLEELKAMAESL